MRIPLCRLLDYHFGKLPLVNKRLLMGIITHPCNSRSYGYLKCFQNPVVLVTKGSVAHGVVEFSSDNTPDVDKEPVSERPITRILEPQEIPPFVSATEITKFLSSHNIPYVEGYTTCILTCPLCLHAPNNVSSCRGKVYVNKRTGGFICYHCKTSGTWSTFRDFVCLLKTSNKVAIPSVVHSIFPTDEVLEDVQKKFENLTPVSKLSNKELQLLRKHFKLKLIYSHTFDIFDVRISDDKLSLFFPLHGYNKNIVALNILQSNGGGDKTGTSKLFPRETVTGVFGFNRVAAGRREIILTSSPADAMTIYQETGELAVSLPKGTIHLPLEVLPFFEQFDKVTIWFGNVMQEWESGKSFARKLNAARCYFIRPQEDHPRPLVALQKGFPLVQILKAAQPITHKSITTFKALRDDVLEELKHLDQVAGVQWKRYTAFSKILKGHRRGELTIFTGPTGAGKTTFMSEYSLDLCMQGVSTLWGSFEIKNARLAKVMLTQFAQLPLDKNLDQFDHWADKFELLPLYFLTFHGEQSLHKVLDAMSHAVYVHDITHVVVDNVNFMLGTSNETSHLDRFWKQDLMVASFRRFATQHDCHVTLVMHPRKQKDVEELNNSSVFGGAKAVQEADNVLILQEKKFSVLRSQKYIQVTKNRYDGELGIIPLEFNRDTYSLSMKKKRQKALAQSTFTSVLPDPERKCDR